MWREGQMVTLAEYLLAEQGWRLDYEVEVPPVCYEGQYNDEEGALVGVWRIDAEPITFSSGARPWTIEVPGGSGRWRAVRVHD